MANIQYKLCPKCELNYIPEDGDICDVCKQLTKGELDIYDDIEEEDLMLCPICNINYILETEEMCESCIAEKASLEEDTENYDYEEDVIIAEDDDILVSLDEIEEEEEEMAKDEDIYDDIDEDDQDY